MLAVVWCKEDRSINRACVCVWLPCLLFHRCPATQVLKWYKFDDGEVTEAKMDDEEVIGKYIDHGEFDMAVMHSLRGTFALLPTKTWTCLHVLVT